MEGYRVLADRAVEHHHRSDYTFLVCVILMLGFGLWTQFFCSQNLAEKFYHDPFYYFKRQLISVAVGAICFLLVSSLKMSAIRKMIPIFLCITFFLCILTFLPFLSHEANGARRWIKMPFGFSLQSSEIVKFMIVLFLANLFDKQLEIVNKDERNVFPCVAILCIFVGIVLAQKDLSTALFIFATCFVLFIVAGMNVKWFFALAILAIPALFIFIASEQYRLDRLLAFVRPELGENTINYQSITAKRAISAGGIFGSGIGPSFVQSFRVPEMQTDYVFAGWAESMGLFGVFLYFVLLGVFVWRGYKIALTSSDRFASIASFGFVTMILCQSILNCAVVSGVLPTTGIPLPFFSIGGSSIIVTLCMCGFILNVSRLEVEEKSLSSQKSYSKISEINGVFVYE